ncbi:MAG: hypothetical protein C4582_07195 [Desulfobacteraceae bacterium]|jgi:menaquinone-dependent protoporphyrinogen oxidase|nr:MAG: hypothetical protein C4582_07195 [Desulfobacteraceae bacterium]
MMLIFKKEGIDIMSNKVLVAYASKSGSTREAAEAVGRVLQESGLEVEVYPVAQIKNVDPYQAVIIGSAVRVGRLLPEALKFAEKHAGELAHKKTAYFTVCMTMHEDTPKNRETAALT